MLSRGKCEDATRCFLTYRAVEHGTGKVLSQAHLLLQAASPPSIRIAIYGNCHIWQLP
jgi:hypothetical protein